MMKHLNALRAKPDHVKRRITLLTSLGITVIIFLFWVASFGIQSSALVGGTPGHKIETPFSALTANIGNIFTSLKDSLTGADKKPSLDAIEIGPGNR